MNILITGGTGLIGNQLTELLERKGHRVNILTRSETNIAKHLYHWDLKSGFVEKAALENIQAVIHLAGAGIVDEKWTDDRKQEIINSRIRPLEVLEKAFTAVGELPKTIVSASAIGIYGFDTGEQKLTEESTKSEEYIGKVVQEWENAIDLFAQKLKIRCVKLRIGIVLDKNGGALPQMALPVKLFVGSPLGSGKQWISWIHSADLCEMFAEAVENPVYDGVYNAVAPNPVTNSVFTKTLGQVLKKPIWAPNVPAFALKLILGERAQLVLGGNRVSSEKISNIGYQFHFKDLKEALINNYKGNK